MNAVDLAKLRTPFAARELEWKIQRCGYKGAEPWAQTAPFVDARAVMKRLDEVAGPENWQSRLVPTPNGGMLCELSLRLSGEWITKMDGAEDTEYEPFRGGIAKSLVRAAVHWGIGREVEQLPPGFARFVEKGTPGAQFVKIEGRDLWWLPPAQGEQPAAPAAAEARAAAPASAPAVVATAPLPVNPAALLPGAGPQGPTGGVRIPTATKETRPASPAPSSARPAGPSFAAPRAAASASATATLPRPVVPTVPLAATRGPVSEAVVPFGHNQGKRLSELGEAELAGLADFYVRVPEPKGKAKLFKRDFDQYMSQRARAS